MKQFPCVESTIDITDGFGFRRVRLWINRKDIPKAPELEFYQEIEQIKNKLADPSISHDELLLWLSAAPNVNAVQLLQKFGDREWYGTVVYTVPFEDVHG